MMLLLNTGPTGVDIFLEAIISISSLVICSAMASQRFRYLCARESITLFPGVYGFSDGPLELHSCHELPQDIHLFQ